MRYLTDEDLIARQYYADEVRAEYGRHGDVGLAIRTVSARHTLSREQAQIKIERLKQEYEKRITARTGAARVG